MKHKSLPLESESTFLTCHCATTVQVPMWTLDSSSNAIIGVMDMYDLDLLKDNFLAHYNGNRAPFGVFLHPRYETATRCNSLLVVNTTSISLATLAHLQHRGWVGNCRQVYALGSQV